jgi:hypothetical protein
LSRGPGICQRAILKQLKASGEGHLTRAELEDCLVPLGYRSDTILRSIRGLDRLRLVRHEEGRFAETSTVALNSEPVVYLSNEQLDEILKLLAES